MNENFDLAKFENIIRLFPLKWFEDRKKNLFSWNEIPGNDNGKLIEVLEQKYKIGWVKPAKIEKIDDGKAINVYTEKNSLSLRLNDDKTKVNLKIDDGRIDVLIAKMEKGKLNIYKNERHILIEGYKELENNPKDKYYLKYFHEIDTSLNVVYREEQMKNDMINKLNNNDQFEDTLSEIKVFSYLISNGIKCKFEKFPDIKIINRDIGIEIKNFNDSEKLTDNSFSAKRLAEKPEYMEKLDDISRIRSRIDEEIINKINDKMLNIIIIDVTKASSILFDEFEDLSEVIFEINKDSSKKNYNKISAIVMLEGKYLTNLSFKGIINPMNQKIIPEDIMKLFNLKRIDAI